MARAGMTKSKMLLIRSCKEISTKRSVDNNCLNKFASEAPPKATVLAHAQDTSSRPAATSSNGGKTAEDSTYWVPHGRTGIYFPKGYEHVMDDVPAGAASFSETYWLRNQEY
ncbi:putative Late embryogenesis abundant protein Lea5 [Quillaja saponaria]|uniref:Late embryogenesis abundant protein Lea5 n=1 Tax=Quillaja saponaria TaxID=32244 RepID=A0AAD7P8A8_QUISA|nr:putative Late embryogenesis abundant protein Lea5 [Quillaja saponaria]